MPRDRNVNFEDVNKNNNCHKLSKVLNPLYTLLTACEVHAVTATISQMRKLSLRDMVWLA